ncbi:MAG TPA: chemotaxis protein CheD [Thermoanaerobaculia bacterium]|nr:chemotaxis protein CheD [Thermoanaerobaculia bacterium]
MKAHAVPPAATENRSMPERKVYLHPGGLWTEPFAAAITTVLGSCVSVCLWDPLTAVGGINHFILPHGGAAPSARYGNHALPMLLDRVLENGARGETLLACVFGGASVMPGDGEGPLLGSRNVAEAFDFLERNGITVLRHDVEGRQGRKLTFRTTDGTTLIRKL